MRPTDVLGRVGGDEFILFLPGVTGAELVNRCVERLRAAFSALLDDSLRSCGVTCSIGVARYPEDGGDCVISSDRRVLFCHVLMNQMCKRCHMHHPPSQKATDTS